MTNDHLSEWEMEELIIASNEDSGRHSMRAQSGPAQHESIADDRTRQHLAGCELCTLHIDRVQELLLLYRDDAVQSAATLLNRRDAHAAALGTKQKTSFDFLRWGVWTLSLALILLLAVTVPLFQRHQQKREQHEAQIAQDNLLLEQVDEEVDSSVPHPLQSLTNLVVAREKTNE